MVILWQLVVFCLDNVGGCHPLSEVDGVVRERDADLDDMGAVGADGLVEEVAGDVELPRPIRDVGGDFGVDGVGIGGNLVAVLGLRLFDGTAEAMMSEMALPRFGFS